MTTVSNVWDKEQPKASKKLKPIEVLAYVRPCEGGAIDRAPGTNLRNYDHVVRIRGDQNCIIMCWNGYDEDEDANLMHTRDIFIARWNDGIV